MTRKSFKISSIFSSTFFCILAFFTLVLTGCAEPILNMSKSDIRKIESNERFGVVFGAVRINVEGKPFKKVFSHSLHNTQWAVSARMLSEKSSIYSIEVVAAGDEVPFVAKLPIGLYSFFEMEETGWTAGQAAKGFIKSYFRVYAEKPTYIGRLLLTIPNHKFPSFNGISMPLPVAVTIEDAQTDTAGLLEDEYGDIIANSTKKLMVKDFDELDKGYHEW